MIKFTTGDILKSDAEALVNTVNCVGVMGRGIALQFKKRFPENFKAYEQACELDEVQPGRMFVYETRTLTTPRFIVNFPTKRHWRGKSRLEDIELGLHALVREIETRHIKSIAIPPLGSGLGGLDWPTVKSLIISILEPLKNVELIVYEPGGAPEADKMVKSREVPRMTEGRAALVVLMNRYLHGLMDPFVTLLEVHKLMYFLQESGQRLRLNFQKGHYGPYADNLRHVLNQIEGHLVSGYADGGDSPRKQLELVPGAFVDAEGYLKNKRAELERLDRIASLVDGFESPFGLELLATVHWVVKHEGATSAEEAICQIYNWNDGKKQFSPKQIEIAFERLASRAWQ
ncbi:MAG: macro domain-containing protein [Henriciella sp.]|uniref:type II toxin-antitoxin system antitoxin DNA ADP-ribosyl glycohydrolase DarG n=1 Tax=Henriciella sp. TaxID=1968823 RepID=UPI0032EB3524